MCFVFRRLFLRIFLAVAVALLATSCRSSRSAAVPVAPGVQVKELRVVDYPGIAEPQDDPAEIVPGDSHFYARFRGLRDYNNPVADPFVEHAEMVLAPLCPQAAWTRAAGAFGISERELFNRLFGTDVAIVDHEHPRRSPLIVISRADAKDVKRLPKALGAENWGGAVAVTGYPMYRLKIDSEQLIFAVGHNWFFFADGKDAAALQALLIAPAEGEGRGAESLAVLPSYRELTARLPAKRLGTLFARAKDADYHAAAVIHTDFGYEMESVSRVAMPAAAAADVSGSTALPFLAQRHELDFGPLPRRTAAAATLNVLHRHPQNLGILDIPMIFGAVRSTIIPGVEPPLIGFIGDVPAPELGADAFAPAIGVCVRVPDAAAADAIDSVLRTFHLLATLGALELKQTLFGIKSHTVDGVNYKSADFGNGIVARLPSGPLLPLADLPAPAGLRQISYGRIGEWYVICSQERFFNDCIAAANDSAQRWVPAADFGLKPYPQLMATAAVDVPRVRSVIDNAARIYASVQKAPGTAPPADPEAAGPPLPADRPFKHIDDLMHTVSDVANELSGNWVKMHTDAEKPPEKNETASLGEAKRKPASASKPPPPEETEKALRPLQWLTDALGRHHSFSAQIWREADGNPGARVRFTNQD